MSGAFRVLQGASLGLRRVFVSLRDTSRLRKLCLRGGFGRLLGRIVKERNIGRLAEYGIGASSFLDNALMAKIKFARCDIFCDGRSIPSGRVTFGFANASLRPLRFEFSYFPELAEHEKRSWRALRGPRSAQVPSGASLKHLPSGAKGAAAAGGRGRPRARAISPFFVDFLYGLLSKVLAGQLCLRQKWD